MNLSELRLEAENDLKLNDSNLIKSSMDNGLIIAKWLEYYSTVSADLVQKQSELTKIECLLTLYYKGKANGEQLQALNKKPFQLKLTTESDVSKFIKSSNEYINCLKEVKVIENTIKFIEEVIQNIKFQHLRIQNIINYKKFMNGE